MECERCKFLMEVLTSRINMEINPPIVIQIEDKYYSKEIIDELMVRSHRTYWQKLWAAIRGR